MNLWKRQEYKASVLRTTANVLSVAKRFMFIFGFYVMPILFTGRSALFAIVDKYPSDEKIVLKKGVSVSFNCSSTRSWWVIY